MRLTDKLPDRVKVGRRTYRVDLDFRNVLRMIDILSREDLLQASKEYLALRCVMRRPPRNTGDTIAALTGMLFSGGKKEEKEKLTDFEQDADLIRAAFLQAYGINLWRDGLHWLEFTGLLAGLPEGSRYAEIISIRARPMPEATKYNAKERAWLAKAKADYAVKKTDKEIAENYARSVENLAAGLMAFAERGGKNGG